MTPEQLRVGGGGRETREKCDEERRERKRRGRRTNEPKVNARMDECRGEKRKEKKSALFLYRLSKKEERNSQGRIWQQQTLMNSRSLIKTNKHTHTCVCTRAAN